MNALQIILILGASLFYLGMYLWLCRLSGFKEASYTFLGGSILTVATVYFSYLIINQ